MAEEKRLSSEEKRFNFYSSVVFLHNFVVLRNLLEVRLERANEGHDVFNLLMRDVELGEHRLEGSGDDVEVLERSFFFER